MSNVTLNGVPLRMAQISAVIMTGTTLKRFLAVAILPFLTMLTACNAVVMGPSGDVAAQQRDLIVISTILMLIIIVPVMLLTVFFAWRYRQSNAEARYEPDWDHSTQLELIIWAAPL